jgi:predicted MFS family arabinose efflux permease
MTETRKTRGIGAVIAFGLIACLLYGLGAGIRGDIGILLKPLSAHSGLPYEDVSLCIAIMELVFGLTQPFFGLLASRKSNRLVLELGSVLLIVSMAGMLLVHSFIGLALFLGVIFGVGAGAISFGMVLTSAIHFVGPQYSMLLAGMLNAAAGMVSFFLSPGIVALLQWGGIQTALTALGFLCALLIPITLIVTSHDPRKAKGEQEEEYVPVRKFFKEALQNRTYRLLLAGFSTCGFHMVIIESHLFSQFLAFGIADYLAGWAFSVYGISTITGALLSGYLSTRLHKGHLLGFYYGFRAVWVLGYIFFVPKTFVTALIFSAGLGFTGDATVSPTSGLVQDNFSLSKTATLIGLLFAGHQIGAFFSAYLGGVIVSATGGYSLLWIFDIILCSLASFASLRIW